MVLLQKQTNKFLNMRSYNPLGNQFTQINTNPTQTASTASTASTTASASTTTASTASGVDKNASSGLDSILNLATQGAQLAGTIKYQRQQSGASASRQARIAQCGRRPLIGRAKKEAYQKCLDNANKTLPTDTSDINKTLVVDDGGSSMKFVWVALAIAVAGGIGYMIYKKSK
jgi:hypothetical protein